MTSSVFMQEKYYDQAGIGGNAGTVPATNLMGRTVMKWACLHAEVRGVLAADPVAVPRAHGLRPTNLIKQNDVTKNGCLLIANVILYVYSMIRSQLDSNCLH